MFTIRRLANPTGLRFALVLLLFPWIACSRQNETNPPDNELTGAVESSRKKVYRILVLGDSLTEGYGVSTEQAYPSLLERRLNEDNSFVNLRFKVINAGVTGSTTSGGLSRLDWHLKSCPDLMILALGGNDGLRGLDLAATRTNLSQMIDRAQEKNVRILLAGMKLPPNYGKKYSEDFENLFSKIAGEKQVSFLPFLLEGVGGKASMNLPDRIHPNPDGHRRISETLFRKLRELLPSS